MLTYIYINVDECRLTSSMPQQISLNCLIVAKYNTMWFLEVSQC